ncbi:hypothetical protein ScPMuIL_017634 [Solemya velum]
MEEKTKRYEKIEFLGEGQFATVYKARDTHTDDIVAVKKIKVGTRAEAADGINRTALREIKLLQELSHRNIIGLLDVFGQRSNVSLVFDFMETDLEVIIKDNSIVLTPAHTKSYILQTLKGLEYLHTHWILHRDLKPNNLLINDKVVTRWYRCPELLFGARQYGTGIDMWAVGCILAELLLRTPFLPGDSDIDQLSRIFQALGTPRDEDWPGIKALPDFVQFKHFPGTPLREIFIAASDDLLEVLSKFLAMDPLKRCTSTECLKMDYFKLKPYPTPGPQLPRAGGNQNNNKNPDRTSLKRKLETDSGGLAKRLIF